MNELLKRLGVNIDVTLHLIVFSLVWVRTLMMVSVVPFLFSKPVPRYVAVGLAFLFALFAYPNLIPANPPVLHNNYLWLMLLYFKEAFLGLTIGFAISVFFQAFSSAGQMIDNQRGVSIARLLIPQLGQQGSLVGTFLFQLGVVIFLAAGGHRVFLTAFMGSFEQLPIFYMPAAGARFLPMLNIFARVTGDVFMIALQLAAPVIIAIFLADIILGMTNRFAPQINVWELGFNVKGYLGVLMLFLALTAIAGQMQRYGRVGNQTAADVIKSLMGRAPPAEEQLIPSQGERSIEQGIPRVITVPSGENTPQP